MGCLSLWSVVSFFQSQRTVTRAQLYISYPTNTLPTYRSANTLTLAPGYYCNGARTRITDKPGNNRPVASRPCPCSVIIPGHGRNLPPMEAWHNTCMRLELLYLPTPWRFCFLPLLSKILSHSPSVSCVYIYPTSIDLDLQLSLHSTSNRRLVRLSSRMDGER